MHQTYVWVSSPQMALLVFFLVNSLFASPKHSCKMQIHRPTGIVIERSQGGDRRRRKKEEEKSAEKHHFTVTRI